ncbi:MAG: S8 family serine peptidase [Terricaulis sp.]
MFIAPIRLAAFVLLAAAFAGPAAAQLPGGLGGAVGDVTSGVGGAVGRVGDTVEGTSTGVLDRADGAVDTLRERTTRELRAARETEANLLRRAHPDIIDVDRNGDIVVRSEVVAVAPSTDALAAARARGFTISQTTEESALGLTIVVLRAPSGMSTRNAVDALREIDPAGTYDFNHVYLGAGANEPGAPGARQSSGGGGSASGRIGLIDSGVDASHPALAGLSIRQRGFVGSNAIAGAHGTAVASLLAGDAPDFHGAAPGASLSVADVYGGQPNGGGAAAIVAALGWLAEQRTGVVNVSLVGPPNRALEAGVRAMVARGFVIVAAVGNDGPSAPPLYPAAYPGVIGVTGVDARDRVLPEAGRGGQVDFAAPGSDITAAAPGGGYARVRGTSYAAPIVAGLIARNLSAPNPDAAARAEAQLTSSAADLGARGADQTFGAGVVGRELRNSEQRVAARNRR